MMATVEAPRRVDEHLVGLVSRIGNLWGQVTSTGVGVAVGVAVTLPRSKISEMVGIRRPSVSPTIGSLRRHGAIRQGDDGLWRIAPGLSDYREQREERARALGYENLRDYLSVRYVRGGARIEDLQGELGVSYSAVRGDLRRAGIRVHHGDNQRSVRPALAIATPVSSSERA